MRSLYEIFNEAPNVNITLNKDQFLSVVDHFAEIRCKELEEKLEREKNDGTCSPKEAGSKLYVSLPTLNRWEKSGYLVPISIGGKRRYRMSDINRILEGGK